jgi:hypothetical protein
MEIQEHLSYGEKENDDSENKYHQQPVAEKQYHAPQDDPSALNPQTGAAA